MFLSLAVILVPVLLIVWFFTRTPDEPNIQKIDWRPVATSARTHAGYPVLAPKEVPEDWRPTKARYANKGDRWVGNTISAGNRWELGFLTSENIYLAVNQISHRGWEGQGGSVHLDEDGQPGWPYPCPGDEGRFLGGCHRRGC